MAITINHPFVSAKGDGSDATLVRPSNWNASHNLNMATSKIVGRLTAGPGLAEELPVTAYMIGLLNSADFAALAVALGLPTTGDAKLTFKIVADSGWVFANDGSIGDTGSGGTTRANGDTVNLFVFFYNTFSDAVAPLQTSAGAPTSRAAQGTAANAFSVNKCRMVLPRQMGRALIVAGTGAGLTSRALGDFGGEEAHVLTLAELASHSHTQQGTFGGSGSGSGSISATGGGGTCGGTTNFVDRTLNHRHHASGTTQSMNRSNPHHHSYSVVNQSQQKPLSGGVATYFDTIAANTGDTDINHEHNFDFWTDNVYGEVDVDLNHKHGFSGSIAITSITGSCSVTTINVSTTISGQTVASGSSLGHNNMQPWAAWNIMIRL